MRTLPKKIRRRRAAGEIGVEQTQDTAAVATMLQRAGMTAAGSTHSGGCFLMAYCGDDPVGIAGLETEVDAALMRPLFVLELMRRRGAGAALVNAARVAAHTRGARMLYAIGPTMVGDYLARFGFSEVAFAELATVFGDLSPMNSAWPDDLPRCCALCLDISHDGLIER